MTRRSAAKDASIWGDTVLKWCGSKRASISRGFLMNLDAHIDITNSLLTDEPEIGATNSARGIIAYFCVTSRAGHAVDHRVLQFLEEARQRYSKDPRRDIAKALLLVRLGKRGNPGGASGSKKLTPEARTEAAEMVLEKMSKNGLREKRAIGDVADEFGVSTLTIRKAVAEHKGIVEAENNSMLNFRNKL